MKARIAVGVLAIVLVTGCGARAAGSRPSPSVSPSTNAATSAINTAFKNECAAFDNTYNTIQSATQGQTTVGQLMATLTGGVGNTATGWSKQLSTAAKYADAPGVPVGDNKARTLAVKIDAVGLGLANLQLDADLGKLKKVPGAWSGVLDSIDAVRSAGCS